VWRSLVAVSLGVFCAAGPTAAQNVFFVDSSGDCDGESPCSTTIQAAVNGAVAGDIILVFAGVYAESVDLSSMSVPGDITIVGPILDFGQLPLPAAAPARGANGPPWPAGSAWQGVRQKAREALADLDLLLANEMLVLADEMPEPSRIAAVAAGDAEVSSPAGPAFYNSAVPFPGLVTIQGLTVHSPDDDGIRIDANGDVTVVLVQSNMNGRNGINLSSRDEDVGVVGCTTNLNMAGGIIGNAMDDVTVLNTVAEQNTANGMTLGGGTDVQVFKIAVDGADSAFLAALPEDVSASDNRGHGILASAGENIGVGTFLVNEMDTEDLIDLLGGTVARKNDLDGMNLTAQNEINLVLATSEMNKMSGVVANAMEDVEIVFARSNENTVDGVRVDSGGTLTALGLTVQRNQGTGLLASTNGATGFFLGDDVGAILTGVNASGNRVGVDLSSSAAGVFVDSNAFIGNTTNGIVLNDLGPGETRVTGNIICSNTGAGLRSNVDAEINAMVDWWGDASGPLHAAKNPTGTGDAVVDGTSGGGAGNVTLTPFIDTITGSIEPIQIGVGQPATVRFRFSGADGTVFMGFLGGFLGASGGPPVGFVDPPLQLSTAAGVLSTEAVPPMSGPTVLGFVNNVDSEALDGMMLPPIEEIPVVFQATLVPTISGQHTVDLTGPCGIESSVSFVAVLQTAPVMHYPFLLLLGTALAFLGFFTVRRRSVGTAKHGSPRSLSCG
jgi:hypothetical protein